MSLLALEASTTLTAVASTVSAIILFVGVVAKFKDHQPVQWILERLVMQPVGEALDRRIDDRVEESVKRATSPMIDKLNAIYGEMFNNSGTSLRDAVDRTEGSVVYLSGEVEGISTMARKNASRIEHIEGSLDVLIKGQGR